MAKEKAKAGKSLENMPLKDAFIEDLQDFFPGFIIEEPLDRVKDWEFFSNAMHDYINGRVTGKYQAKSKEMDLMHYTHPIICIWNIIKYAFRIWKGHAKPYDLFKIAHYAQIAHTNLQRRAMIVEQLNGEEMFK